MEIDNTVENDSIDESCQYLKVKRQASWLGRLPIELIKEVVKRMDTDTMARCMLTTKWLNIAVEKIRHVFFKESSHGLILEYGRFIDYENLILKPRRRIIYPSIEFYLFSSKIKLLQKIAQLLHKYEIKTKEIIFNGTAPLQVFFDLFKPEKGAYYEEIGLNYISINYPSSIKHFSCYLKSPTRFVTIFEDIVITKMRFEPEIRLPFNPEVPKIRAFLTILRHCMGIMRWTKMESPSQITFAPQNMFSELPEISEVGFAGTVNSRTRLFIKCEGEGYLYVEQGPGNCGVIVVTFCNEKKMMKRDYFPHCSQVAYEDYLKKKEYRITIKFCQSIEEVISFCMNSNSSHLFSPHFDEIERKFLFF